MTREKKPTFARLPYKNVVHVMNGSSSLCSMVHRGDKRLSYHIVFGSYKVCGRCVYIDSTRPNPELLTTTKK